MNRQAYAKGGDAEAVENDAALYSSIEDSGADDIAEADAEEDDTIGDEIAYEDSAEVPVLEEIAER